MCAPWRLTFLTPGSIASDRSSSVCPIGWNLTRYSPPAESTSPAGVSSAAIRPRSKIATRSQSSSTSSMKWLTSTTVTPLSLTWPIRSQVARLAPGSRPAVSSSRNTTSGSPTRASAMNSRCFCPPDSLPNLVSAFPASPQRSSSSRQPTGCG